MSDTGQWLCSPDYSRQGGVDRPELRLVCFPHAGGSPGLFRGWQQRLPERVDLRAVCYPGRHNRFSEPCATTMDELADGIVAALAPLGDTPMAFFGHSMGAAVAYEVALRLDARHGIQSIRLFASGRCAPHRVDPSQLHDADDATFLAEIRKLGAASSDVLAEPAVATMLLPVLRADFALIETYGATGAAKVRCPIVAYVGDRDEECPTEDVRAWREVTSGRFEFRVFDGDHFYLEHRQAELLRHVAGHLRDDLRFRHAFRGNGAGRV